MMVSTVGIFLTVVFDGGQYSERLFGGVLMIDIQWMSFAKQLLTTVSTVGVFSKVVHDGQYSGCLFGSSLNGVQYSKSMWR